MLEYTPETMQENDMQVRNHCLQTPDCFSHPLFNKYHLSSMFLNPSFHFPLKETF